MLQMFWWRFPKAYLPLVPCLLIIVISAALGTPIYSFALPVLYDNAAAGWLNGRTATFFHFYTNKWKGAEAWRWMVWVRLSLLNGAA